MKDDKKRIVYIDILKIIACFLVIVNHTWYIIFKYGGYNKTSILFHGITLGICKVGVPIFLMITGYFLLNRDNIEFKSMIKKIWRIFLPLVVLSLYVYIRDNGFSFKFFVSFLKEPIVFYYWYLYMLIGLYLIFPYLNKMVKKLTDKDLRNIIIICLIIPSFLKFISAAFNVAISEFFTMGLLCYPVVYSIAGIYLSRLEKNKRNRNIAWICFIVPIIIFTLHMFIVFLQTNDRNAILDNVGFITTVLPSLAVFYLSRYYLEDKTFSNKASKFIGVVAGTTFGIYLFHPFTRFTLEKVFGVVLNYNVYIGIVLVQVSSFIICGIVTWILKKIPLVKKFL